MNERNHTRPNIVFIVSDDHQHNAIGAYGNPLVQTPTLDQLVKEGFSFNNTNIIGGMSGALCAPCRACIHTGNSIFKATVSQTLDDHIENITLRPAIEMMPAYFRENGYNTFATGKWHNDLTSFNRGFQNGENIFFGGMSDHNSVPVYDYDSDGLYEPNKRTTGKQFSSNLFTDAALKFIQTYEEEDPFFLYVAYTAPHDPRTAPEPYASMYAISDVPTPENFLTEHPFDHGAMDIRGEFLAAYPREEEEIRRHIADYYAMITQMDDQMGRIIVALQEKGIYDNTIFVYTSDHGLALGQHGLMAKQSMYDHSIRVPWIIRGPGIPQYGGTDEMCYQFDIFPTLCDAAGIHPPETIEGVSYYPLLAERTFTSREYIFSFYKDVQRAIKNKEWKLIVYRKSNISGFGTDAIQLFHLQEDPLEINNLAFEPNYQQQIEHLQRMLREFMINNNDPYREEFM